MSKNDFQRGIEVAANANQDFMRKQAEATEAVEKRIVQKIDDLGNVIEMIVDDLSKQELERLYSIKSEMELTDLSENERKLLVSLLFTLMTKYNQANSRQKEYFFNVKTYLQVENPTDCDLQSVANIDSRKDTKLIYYVVCEFLFLANGNHTYKEDFSEFLDNFYVKPMEIEEIEERIDSVYAILGLEGLIRHFDMGYSYDEDNFDLNKSLYLNVPEKKCIEVSHECAQIYFNDRIVYDKELLYIESSSYVLYSNGDKIMKIHKSSGVQDVLIEHIKKAANFIKKKKIATFSDVAYYVLGNDLYFIDIETRKSGLICHIPEEKNSDGENNEIKDLCVFKSQKLFFKNGNNYIIDLEEGAESAHKVSFWSETGKYSIRGDYLYFVDMDNDLDDDLNSIKYVVKRYGILNNQITTVSQPFGKHSTKYDSTTGIYELESEGMYENYYYCVFGYQSALSSERMGFECFCINIDGSKLAEAKKFYIWNSRVYQIEQYGQNLIYVNADKDFSLTSHNFLSDKKVVIKKKCGKTEKSSFSDRLILGKGEFLKPDKYMRLGKWLWIRQHDKFTPEIIAL